MKVDYTFDDKTGILYKIYRGEISCEDIITSWEDAFHNNLIPSTVKGFILDYRSAVFIIKPDNYICITEFYKKHLEVFGGKKIAILTDNPKDIVIPTLVQQKDDGYRSKPFTTLGAAI